LQGLPSDVETVLTSFISDFGATATDARELAP